MLIEEEILSSAVVWWVNYYHNLADSSSSSLLLPLQILLHENLPFSNFAKYDQIGKEHFWLQ